MHTEENLTSENICHLSILEQQIDQTALGEYQHESGNQIFLSDHQASTSRDVEIFRFKDTEAHLRAAIVSLQRQLSTNEEAHQSAEKNFILTITALQTKITLLEGSLEAKKAEVALWQQQAAKVTSIINKLEETTVIPEESARLLRNSIVDPLEFKWEKDEDHSECMYYECNNLFGIFRRRY